MLAPTMRCPARFAALLALSLCWAGVVRAQEIEPRSYSPAPTGVNFLIGALGNSTGNVLTDPALPVQNVNAEINALALGYGRTFGLFGRSANLALVAPIVRAHVSGDVGEDRRTVTREGLGDTRLRLGVNLLGGPATTPREFAQREPKTTLGFSLTVSAPTGEYAADRLVNLSTNRWAAKTEFGLVHPVGKWYLEAYAGAWFFGNNDEFLGAHTRSQDPLTSVQAHVSYTFRPRLWLAFDATFYSGGRTTVDGKHNSDRQENSRGGVTFSLPVGKKYSLKTSWSRGASARAGSNFSTFGLGLQYTWMDARAHP
jgi:hypothetical protein